MIKGNVAIIGAGPSGTAAAVQLVHYGISPLVIDMKGKAGGLVENANAIDNFPLLPTGLPGCSFAAMIRTKYTELAIDVVEAEIEGISVGPEGRFYLAPDRSDYHGAGFDAVLIAAGTSPTRIGVDGCRELEGRRVFYEVVDLRRSITPVKAAIIGSGDAAFDYALNLASDPGCAVTIFIRNGREKCVPALSAACRVERRIEIVYDHELARIEEDGSGLSLGFDTPSGRTDHTCDALLCAVGRQSNLPRLVREMELGDISIAGGTDIPGLFVAGDARRGHARQLAIAMGDGTAAAIEISRYLESR